MKWAGFVLAGGRSSRMGRDKALLPWRGRTLVEHVAGAVRSAAGSVTLIGPPERYAALGLPVVADCVEGCGPLGGILTALTVTPAEWNLVAACDMPFLTAEVLDSLLSAAERSDAECVVPVSADGRLQPLCAAYRKAVLPEIRRAVGERRLKITDVVAALRTLRRPAPDGEWFLNMNAPEDWFTHAPAASGATFSTGRAHD